MPDLHSAEDRLDRLESIEQIRQLAARYGILIDARDCCASLRMTMMASFGLTMIG